MGPRDPGRRTLRPSHRRRRRIAVLVALVAVGLVVGAAVVAFGGPRRIAWRIETRLVAPTAPPTPATTRDERWRQNFDYLETNVVRLHADAFHATTRGELVAAFAAAHERVATASDAALMLETMRLVALVGDGHTATWSFLDAFAPLPLRVEPVAGAWSVTAIAVPSADLLAAELLAIGDHDVPTLVERLAPYVAADSEADRLRRTAHLLVRPQALHALGLLPDADRATVRVALADGRTATATFVVDADATLARADAGLLPNRNPDRPHWVVPLEEHGAIYVRYRRASDRAGFAGVAQEALRLLDASPSARLVVDLRGNGGGDSRVMQPLLDGLRERTAGPRTSVLIDAGTYSSATMNARDLRDLGAVLVGEPTGDTGGGWGEVRTFTLPNSGIRVGVSSYFHGGTDAQVVPDVVAAPSVAAWSSGVDPVLDAALRR